MKDSDYAFLLANIFLARFVDKKWAALGWAVHMIIFGIFLYLGH
jgi:hypothetical protein